jgi:SAM-dependent methyltransferase
MEKINILLILSILTVLVVLFFRNEKFTLSSHDEREIERTKILQYNSHVKKFGELSKNTGGGGDKDKAYQGIVFFDSEKDSIKGQRDPEKRLQLMERYLTFNGKSVLDIGCNSGEMLFSLNKRGLKFGVGVDFDPYKINMSNLMKRYNKIKNTDFFVLDLKKENYDIIKTFFPENENKVDIVFLLAVCQKWIYPCTNLINFVYNISDTLVIEINGESESQKKELVEYLNKLYNEVINITNPDICKDCDNRLFFIARNKKIFSTYEMKGKSPGGAEISYDQEKQIVYKKFKIKEIYQKEKYWLNRLQKFPFVPRLLNFDDDLLVLGMTNCGERVNEYNKPIDFNAKLKHIKDTLASENIYHNDLTTIENILVQPNSDLCIIDFEWTSNQKQATPWEMFKGKHKGKELVQYMIETTDI